MKGASPGVPGSGERGPPAGGFGSKEARLKTSARPVRGAAACCTQGRALLRPTVRSQGLQEDARLKKGIIRTQHSTCIQQSGKVVGFQAVHKGWRCRELPWCSTRSREWPQE